MCAKFYESNTSGKSLGAFARAFICNSAHKPIPTSKVFETCQPMPLTWLCAGDSQQQSVQTTCVTSSGSSTMHQLAISCYLHCMAVIQHQRWQVSCELGVSIVFCGLAKLPSTARCLGATVYSKDKAVNTAYDAALLLCTSVPCYITHLRSAHECAHRTMTATATTQSTCLNKLDTIEIDRHSLLSMMHEATTNTIMTPHKQDIARHGVIMQAYMLQAQAHSKR